MEQDGKTVTNPDYTNYVVPARQACAWDATAKSPATLVFFIVLLLIVLVSMAVFRSPAVALMPDVTLKPLRSKANAVINLMGSAGGILVLALGMVFATSAVRNSLMSYTGYFAVIAAIMLAALVVYAFGWQQVIKHLPLTTAYANKAITVVWGILLGFLLFGESITLRQFIGAAVIIVGIVLFVRADNEEEGGQ